MSTSDGTVVGATKIVDHGFDLDRFVITILSEGYQQAELPTFAADALSFANTLAATPPFPTLWPGINVYRVDVSSTDSGASDTGNCGQPQVTAKTYFDALFCPSGSGADSHRLLTVNSATARSVATANVPGTDMTFVIVNSASYGGSGDTGVAVLSKHPDSVNIGIHEMGHSAFGLADEYASPAPTEGGDSYSGSEPVEPNVTIVTDKTTIKWKDLLTAGVTMPTTKNADCSKIDPQASPVAAGTVGTFEGARYFHCGIFRPEFDCMMKTLGTAFCHVCSATITSKLQPFLPPAGTPPTIDHISPVAGDPAGGTIVVITGNAFTGSGSVNFGANAAVTFNIDSDSQITAVSPAGIGTVSVWVATAIGATSATAGPPFAYSAPPPPPQVTGVAPNSGSTLGGTSVVISGAGFTGAAAVAFGATAAANFNIDSDTQITATSPASTAGTVDISVTGATGTSSASGADRFSFAVPTPAVTAISPSSGPAAGGTNVTVTGTSLSGATAVTFGTTGATFIVNSDTDISATSPGGTGTVDVLVTTPAGTSAADSADQFTYVTAIPTITSVAPQSGDPAGGTSVVITGSGFTGATAVAFGPTAAPGSAVNSDTQITATSPPGTGTVDITVTTPAGTSATGAADQYIYAAAGGPQVTSVAPNTGSGAGGDSIVISGTGFTGATLVNFGTNAASFNVDNDGQITATSPGGSGTVDVIVTTSSGTSPAGAADQFTYTSLAAVAVISVSPNNGSIAGGDQVTITGVGFTGATAVTFGTIDAASFQVDSDVQITVTTPAAAGTGTVDVTVTAPGGTSPTGMADQFTYF